MRTKKLTKVIIAILIVVVLCLIVFGIDEFTNYIKFENDYKEFVQRKIVQGKAVLSQDNSVNMDYIYQDNIGVKIDSILLDSKKLDFELDFMLDKNQNLDIDKLKYGIAVYDENNNIYGVYENMSNTNNYYWKKLYRELNVKYNEKDVFAIQLYKSMGLQYKRIGENGSTIHYISSEARDSFPASKKLYIRIFNINITTFNDNKMQNNPLSNAEWVIEVDMSK